MENLRCLSVFCLLYDYPRYLLSDKNSSSPVYFGHKFKPYVEQGYFSGGAGYVLSKEALKR